MAKINQAAISFHDELVKSLCGDEEAQIEYIKANFEDNGDLPSAILSAIRTVAEARGFKNFAAKANLNRENLYRVLSEGGNPRLDTFFKILDALELRLTVEVKSKVG
jgi:probable addiction module antidote protein